MQCGWLTASLWHPEAGAAQISEGLAAYRVTGAEHMVPYYLALHAKAHATGLYASRGFARLGAPFREAGIEHVRMEKQLA